MCNVFSKVFSLSHSQLGHRQVMQIVHTGEGSTWAHIVLNHFTVFARSAIDDKSEFLHII
jgi:hypothetical protein